jgi:hypothetical protein
MIYQNNLEKLARDKHFSFLRKLVNYGQKGFITLGPDVSRPKCAAPVTQDVIPNFIIQKQVNPGA